jgi:hypothetical protein
VAVAGATVLYQEYLADDAPAGDARRQDPAARD